MREIKFRGLRTDGKGWAHGSLIVTTDFIKHMPNQHTKTWIVTRSFGNGGWFNVRAKYCIISETVGQFTGLKDKDGVEIYEGDFINIAGSEHIVEYRDGAMGYDLDDIYGFTTFAMHQFMDLFKERASVTGNIHQSGE